MATSKTKKASQLQAIEERFKVAQGAAFATINKMTVEELERARKELRTLGMKASVTKKTLIVSIMKKNHEKI